MAEIGVGAESQEEVYSILSQAGPDSVLSRFRKIIPEKQEEGFFISTMPIYVLTIAFTSSKILAMFHFWQQ